MTLHARNHPAIVFLLCLAAGGLGCRGASNPPVPTPEEVPYVGNAVCASCHGGEAEAWTGSDHDRAMQPATPETVLGDFDRASFSQFGVETHFFREGDRFFVRTEGTQGRPDTFQVAYTFGIRPLQQYLVPFPDGRVQALTIAWDTERKRWFSLYPDEKIPPGDWLHWTGGGMTWNYMCADCHSTNLQKNFDLASNSYQTTFSEIDVGCEACHGPGGQHVDWARAAAGGDAAYTGDVGLTVQLKGKEHARTQVETCAPCHARRGIVYPGYVPGRPFLDHYAPSLLEADLYFPDGQIRDEVYVYGSFLQSKMYHNGVRCTDCHDPHTARVRFEDNRLCTQCHEATAFDAPKHHFHAEGTAGAACVSCHMPQRTYMQVDPRRDHSFKVPRPDLTVALGVPNACNGCHQDRPAAWARDRVEAWYGPTRAGTESFAAALAGGQAGAPGSEQALIALARDSARPAIARATALSILQSFASSEAQAAAEEALHDAEPLVRFAAVRALDHASPDRLSRQVAPLLADSVRLVRSEAARVLAPHARRFGPQTETMQAFRQALAEYRAGQEAVGDQPPAHLNLAVAHEDLGETAQAEQAYRTALRLDSAFVPAHVNLAMLLNQRRLAAEQAGRQEEARQLGSAVERHLKTAARLASGEVARVHYMLGLLLAEQEARLPEAAAHLRRAAESTPDDARIQYNAGLAFQRLGKTDDAEAFLLRAYQQAPEEPDFLNALTIFYMQQEAWREAAAYNEKMIQRFPNEPSLRQRAAYIVQRGDRGW